jgi:hypothetical protein
MDTNPIFGLFSVEPYIKKPETGRVIPLPAPAVILREVRKPPGGLVIVKQTSYRRFTTNSFVTETTPG